MRLKFCVPELDTASSPSTHNLLHRFSLRSLLSQIFGLSSQALTLESRPVKVVALSTTLSSSLSRRPYQAHSLKSLPSQAHSPYDPLKLTLPTTLSSSLSRVLRYDVWWISLICWTCNVLWIVSVFVDA